MTGVIKDVSGCALHETPTAIVVPVRKGQPKQNWPTQTPTTPPSHAHPAPGPGPRPPGEPRGAAKSCVSGRLLCCARPALGASPRSPRVVLAAIPSTWRSLITPAQGGPHPNPTHDHTQTQKQARTTNQGPPWAGVITRREVDGMAARTTQPNPHPKPRPSRRPAPPARSRRRQTTLPTPYRGNRGTTNAVRTPQPPLLGA